MVCMQLGIKLFYLLRFMSVLISCLLFYSLWLELWSYFVHFILFIVVKAILFTVVRVILFTVVRAKELLVDPSLTFFNFFFFF